MGVPDFRSILRALRRLTRRHRRPLAALLAGAATFVGVQALAPPAPETAALVVARHDLTAGSVLHQDDVRVANLQPDSAPQHAVRDPDLAIGRTVAAPMREGEIFTDRRLVSGSLLEGYGAGLVALPVRITDEDAVDLLQVGDRIDVYAAVPAAGQEARLVVTAASVVSLPSPRHDTTADGALVVLAVTPAQAADLAQASATSTLFVALRN